MAAKLHFYYELHTFTHIFCGNLTVCVAIYAISQDKTGIRIALWQTGRGWLTRSIRQWRPTQPANQKAAFRHVKDRVRHDKRRHFAMRNAAFHIHAGNPLAVSMLLVLLAQKVVHRLYGIERGERNFHEDGVPVAHRTVPQSGQLECLQLAAVLALAAYEAGRLIHIVR